MLIYIKVSATQLHPDIQAVMRQTCRQYANTTTSTEYTSNSSPVMFSLLESQFLPSREDKYYR